MLGMKRASTFTEGVLAAISQCRRTRADPRSDMASFRERVRAINCRSPLVCFLCLLRLRDLEAFARANVQRRAADQPPAPTCANSAVLIKEHAMPFPLPLDHLPTFGLTNIAARARSLIHPASVSSEACNTRRILDRTGAICFRTSPPFFAAHGLSARPGQHGWNERYEQSAFAHPGLQSYGDYR